MWGFVQIQLSFRDCTAFGLGFVRDAAACANNQRLKGWVATHKHRYVSAVHAIAATRLVVPVMPPPPR